MQFLPIDCAYSPTVHETDDGIIIMQNTCCAYFKIFTNILEWKIARFIWIAFYKNEENDKCLIKKLPKDIIKNYILKFIGLDQQSIKSKSSGVAYLKIKT